MSTVPGGGYPLPAFYFRVDILGTDGTDTSFKEVRGISAQMDTEELVEGGENSFVYKLPKAIKASNLVLKRGVAATDSPLVQWCQAIFTGGLAEPIEPKQLEISLLNENHEPVRRWSFEGAFPVKWEVDAFESTKNDIAIETVELSYRYSNRIL